MHRIKLKTYVWIRDEPFPLISHPQEARPQWRWCGGGILLWYSNLYAGLYICIRCNHQYARATAPYMQEKINSKIIKNTPNPNSPHNQKMYAQLNICTKCNSIKHTTDRLKDKKLKSSKTTMNNHKSVNNTAHTSCMRMQSNTLKHQLKYLSTVNAKYFARKNFPFKVPWQRSKTDFLKCKFNGWHKKNKKHL